MCAEAERLSATMTVDVGVRTIDLLHVAAALDRTASGLAAGVKPMRAQSASPC